MATSTIHVPLPDNLKAFVDAKVAAGDFDTGGDYIRDLIQEDRDRQIASLEARLDQSAADRTHRIPIRDIPRGGLVDYLKALK